MNRDESLNYNQLAKNRTRIAAKRKELEECLRIAKSSSSVRAIIVAIQERMDKLSA